MKRPRDVGTDFDEYARRWRKENYGLESGHDASGVKIDPSRARQVQRPGDEWGDVAPLRQSYRDLVSNFVRSAGPINVLEIGAGGGRSTAVMLEVLGDRAGEYHIVDVSAGFVEVLKERIDYPIHVHIVDDVDLSTLPTERFDLCLAQSSWSHISLYDQYRYLRELRRTLRPGAPMYVSGQFLLGLGHDWTWNRFRRRVHQIDNAIEGVYHEFTSVAALAEILSRLQYEIGCINTAGFLARRGESFSDDGVSSLPGPILVPFNASPHHFLATGEHGLMSFTSESTLSIEGLSQPESVGSDDFLRRPRLAPVPVSTAGPESTIGHDMLALARKSAKRIPGARSLVIKSRRLAERRLARS